MLRLPSELTHVQANACLAQLTAGITGEASVVQLDAGPLQKFDSSALAVLLQFQRQCQAAKKTVSVQGLPRQLMALATLYGIEGLLHSA
ncbi:MAG: anti-anti-sigma factor [Burkholderiales bacterium PBB4]|nr:MAG: anti-anti-sigma factor [Burkholderiales bacterium PBB4]